MSVRSSPPEVIADFQKQEPHHLEGVQLGTLVEITEECGEWYRGRLSGQTGMLVSHASSSQHPVPKKQEAV